MSTGSSNTTSGWVVSDLHLLSRRSDGEARMRELLPKIKSGRVLVLNGDIIDFRWSTRRDHRETAADGAIWLRELLLAMGGCNVHYVLGNHDCVPELRTELDRIAAEFDRFEWHDTAVQLGDALFLHGDCTHRAMTANDLRLYRDEWSRDGRRGATAASAYCAADCLGLTHLVHRCHFPLERTLRRLTHHLDHAHDGWRSRIRHCYFGHTHEPLKNVERGGVMFHNSGSAIRGMKFQPLSFSLPRPGAPIEAPSR